MSASPQKSNVEQLPDFYLGTSFAVSEIELGLRVLSKKVRGLTTAHASKQAVGMKLAAEDVSKLAGQIKALSDTLVSVSVKHVNRNSRA